MSLRRRDFFMGALVTASPLLKAAARPRHVITAMELFEVKVSERGNWLFVRLRTDKGLTGLGEASHGLIGVGLAPRDADAPTKAMLVKFFDLVRGESPFDVAQYRTRGWKLARDGARPGMTAFSAIEQALWDLSGKALDAPVYELLGGKMRQELEVYGNINRATNGDRSPDSVPVSGVRRCRAR